MKARYQPRRELNEPGTKELRMMRIVKPSLLAVLMLAAWSGQARASLVFDFTINNTVGTVSGTVTGEILGLVDNTADQPAAHVLIETFPSQFDIQLLSSPVDATAWTIKVNSFTVANGQVTAADFNGQFGNFSTMGGNGAALMLDYGSNGRNELVATIPAVSYDLLNFDGLPGANIVPENSPPPTPEPPPFTLLATGLVAIAGYGLYRRRRRAGGLGTVC
jgi:MYXO-CTERM domain-containing protein